MSVVVEPTEHAIEQAAERLRAGRLVSFPTETVYGLGARARDLEALDAVYRAKGRPSDHPVIVHLPSLEAVDGWVQRLPRTAEALAEAFWPGPLTLVLRRAVGVPDRVTGGQDTVALRVPAHPVALALLALVPDGVAAPSANRFGRVSPTRAQHVAQEFPELDLWILDGGACRVGLESTILDLSSEQPRLLRPGGVAVEAIERCLGLRLEGVHPERGQAVAVGGVGLLADSASGPVAVPRAESVVDPVTDTMVDSATDTPVPRVPGSLPSHYAPQTPARRIEPVALRDLVPTLGPGTVVMARAQTPAGARCHWIQMPSDAEAYARELYDALRRADAHGGGELVIEQVPDGPAWRAIRDRLERATAPRPPSSV